MPRRRRDPVSASSADEPAPGWLLRFTAADWWDEAERPPGWMSAADPLDVQRWRGLCAHRRWSAAGHEWLAERGRRRDWYALVYPETARNLGMRVPSDARAPGVVEDPPRRLVVRDDPQGHASR